MGQAKQRGTFAERQQAAYDRTEELNVKRQENLKRLQQAEEESNKRESTILRHHVQDVLGQFKRSPLMTADFTLISGFGKVADSPLIQAERKKVIEADMAAL
jgi:hypothetical protein